MARRPNKSKLKNAISLALQIPIGIRNARKKGDSILAKNWPINNLDAKYDTYEKTILAYNREMDQVINLATWHS
jgi:hypothetical protein